MSENASATNNALIGRLIGGKYLIQAPIGVGAMGAIYRAEQTALSKRVAVKVLHRHLMSDASLSQRFHREARMAARISHPHCITIYDFGSTDDDLLYMAMEYVDGRDLAQLVHDEHPLDLKRVIHVAKQVCSALDEAHNAGVIHRDLKPENIMVTRVGEDRDFVKVLDFGIAKPRDHASSGESFQTIAGVVCGTPEYMSPEQARGEPLDARTDLYALGIVLYYLTTRTLPFTGESPLTIVTKHIMENARPPRERNSALPDSFNQLILQLMSKKREHRPPSAIALRKHLEQLESELNHAPDTLNEEETTVMMAAPDFAALAAHVAAARTETRAMPASPRAVHPPDTSPTDAAGAGSIRQAPSPDSQSAQSPPHPLEPDEGGEKTLIVAGYKPPLTARAIHQPPVDASSAPEPSSAQAASPPSGPTNAGGPLSRVPRLWLAVGLIVLGGAVAAALAFGL